jgi:enoyl-CoA hydratase/carnithine racemase
MGEFVRLEAEQGVGTIRLDRPPMNAINEQLLRELHDAAIEASTREDIRAVVLYGGDKLFAAGADIKMMADMSAASVKPMITAMQGVFSVVEEIPRVTIAAITGFCLGGGLELAMCADLRFAAEDARLGQPEIKIGIIPGAGGTQRLPRLIGPARAKDMIYSGRFVEAAEAEAIGLVDAVFPPAEVYDRTMEAARRYADGPTQALRAAKVAINWGSRGDVRTGLVIEREAFSDLFSTDDQKEGMRAFVQKEEPKFSGK